jgi:hypothetical protein
MSAILHHLGVLFLPVEFGVDRREFNGVRLAWIGVDDLDLETDPPGLPVELRTALEAAGTVELDYLEPGQPDYSICERTVCALAGLTCTLADLRRIPLLATPFH